MRAQIGQAAAQTALRYSIDVVVDRIERCLPGDRRPVLRSTLGTWVNYTTTIALQILFASRFGSSAEASGYLISFALVIAIGAVFVSTAQSLYVPRLVSLEGLVLSRGLRKIAALTIWAAGIFGLLAVLAPLLAPIIFGGLDETRMISRLCCGSPRPSASSKYSRVSFRLWPGRVGTG